MNDYHEMWAGLGLDLKTHDMLLEIVGKGYQDVFLSQKNRPEGMGYFDFVMSEIHGLRIKELLDAKAEGRKIIGTFCVFVPEELVLAVDAVCVGLCAGAEFGFEEAEKFIPRNTCSLIKSAFGFKLGKVCPYIECTDLIVGENTCDGKKKAYESYKDIVGNLYVMDLPQMKSEHGKALLNAEYKKFAQKLEEISGRKITVSSLMKGIEIANNKRKAIHRVAALRSTDPAPISGLDALLANQVFFYDNPIRYTASVNTICDELEVRVKKGVGVTLKGSPRILLSGCPMAVPNWKLPFIIENSDAIIVGEEMCTGERGTQNLVETKGTTVDELINNIVDRYFQIDCAVFTPNPSRLEHIKEMVKKYNADGVLHYGLQFCQPYQMESKIVEKELEKAGIPVLLIETDYSQADAGQIKTRVEAFVERVRKQE